MQYRRAFVPGGRYFFTVVTGKRRKIFNDNESIGALREAFRRVRNKWPFSIDAAVVLPDHLHCIWSLPPGDHDFSVRWRLIKTFFTKDYYGIHPSALEDGNPMKRRQSVWQHRFWEHMLRDDEDFRYHVEYIHYNPVKHGYADSPGGWACSSFSRYVKKGLYPENWGAGGIEFKDNIGSE
ncbi:MAG: transposase [Deltaproteobacteria bacterium]|nr:transposase [Deltaproteobacteria bacterium]